jgi:hypothetical protein
METKPNYNEQAKRVRELTKQLNTLATKAGRTPEGKSLSRMCYELENMVEQLGGNRNK